MAGAELRDSGAIVGDQGRRLQARELGDEQFLGRVAHLDRVVDHEGPGVDRLEEKGRVDVAHVERRILAQQNHVEFAQVDSSPGPECGVVADLSLHGDIAPPREDASLVHGEGVGRVDEQAMAPRLAGFHHQEGGVAFDDDPLDGIHLHRDLQRHGALPTALFQGHRRWRRATPEQVRV